MPALIPVETSYKWEIRISTHVELTNNNRRYTVHCKNLDGRRRLFPVVLDRPKSEKTISTPNRTSGLFTKTNGKKMWSWYILQWQIKNWVELPVSNGSHYTALGLGSWIITSSLQFLVNCYPEAKPQYINAFSLLPFIFFFHMPCQEIIPFINKWWFPLASARLALIFACYMKKNIIYLSTEKDKFMQNEQFHLYNNLLLTFKTK